MSSMNITMRSPVSHPETEHQPWHHSPGQIGIKASEVEIRLDLLLGSWAFAQPGTCTGRCEGAPWA